MVFWTTFSSLLLWNLSVLKLFHSLIDFIPRKTFQGISLHFHFFLTLGTAIPRVLYPHPRLIAVTFFLP